MNPEHMCIEEEPEPSPFHGQFEKDLVNTTTISGASAVISMVNTAMSSVYKDSQMKPFTEGVSN